jgi:hypothetical protein
MEGASGLELLNGVSWMQWRLTVLCWRPVFCSALVRGLGNRCLEGLIVL